MVGHSGECPSEVGDAVDVVIADTRPLVCQVVAGTTDRRHGGAVASSVDPAMANPIIGQETSAREHSTLFHNLSG